MIEIHNVTASYAGAEKRLALKNISFSIGKEKAVMIGPNGSGKTSVIKLILGILEKTEGEVTVDGVDTNEIHDYLGLSTNLADVYKLMDGTVYDTIGIFAELKNSDPSNVLKLIDHFQLGSILRKKLFQLSSGEQKMIGNILAMSFSPSIILLDEPFDNVDQSRRIKLIRLLKEVKSDILLNTHELNLLNYLDGWSLYFILDGQIYGKFNTCMLKELYISKGDVPGNLGLIESDIGKFSITINGGDVPISSVSNLNSLFDEVSL